jgi:hypothetical protein
MRKPSGTECSSTTREAVAPTAESGDAPDYEPPELVDIGHFRELTKGSSSSGSSDANSQYYW